MGPADADVDADAAGGSVGEGEAAAAVARFLDTPGLAVGAALHLDLPGTHGVVVKPLKGTTGNARAE